MRVPNWLIRLVRASGRSPARRALDAANRARDLGEWEAAARLYPHYLALRPDDWGVWVQLGNVQKDTGDAVSAEGSYRRAIALAPSQPDPAFQLGHALRQQRRLAEARDAFALAQQLGHGEAAAGAVAEIDHLAAESARGLAGEAREAALAAMAEARRAAAERPDDAEAQRALAEALLIADEPAAAATAAARAWALRPDRAALDTARRAGAEVDETGGEVAAPFLLDIGDLLAFLEATGRVTGIQRVQLGLIEGVLGDPTRRASVLFCFVEQPAGPVWALDHADVEAISRRCLEAKPDPAAARGFVAAARSRARRARLEAARAHVFAGNFWYPADGGRGLRRLLRAAGVRSGALVYDLIPITHPEHMHAGVTAEFRRGVETQAPHWDFALTISRHTARDLARVLTGLGVAPLPPIRPVPLAHRLNSRRAEAGEAWPESLAALRGKPYVLCVGTLESRKNHKGLVQAWALLRDAAREGAARQGEAPPPPLVLVGRQGWLVQDLLDQLAASNNLGGLIHVVQDVSDAELEALYRGCLFSVFPSFSEGWGLPVGESLAAGKLCLASTEGAVPEAGEGFAEPIDPYDIRALAARVRHFATDRAALAAAERRIAEGFRPRGWPEVAGDFLAGLEECLARLGPPRAEPPPPELAAGAVLRARDPAGAAFFARALEGPLGDPEGQTVWLAGREARLTLRAPAVGHVALRFDAVPWAEGNTLLATAGGTTTRHAVLPARPVVLVLPAAGQFAVAFAIAGPLRPRPPERRPIRLGLSGLRHLPGPVERLAEAAPLLFAAARETEAGGIETWRVHCPEGFGPAIPGGVLLTGPGRLRLWPAGIDQPRRVRVQLAFRIGEGEGGVLALEAATRAATAPPPLASPALLAVEAQVRPGEPVEVAFTPPEGRDCALVAAQWGGTGVEARLALLEALLGPPLAGTGVPARLAALEMALGAPAAPEWSAPGRLAALRRRG